MSQLEYKTLKIDLAQNTSNAHTQQIQVHDWINLIKSRTVGKA